MADIQTLERALIKADKAGSAADAKIIAGEIRKIRAQGQEARHPTLPISVPAGASEQETQSALSEAGSRYEQAVAGLPEAIELSRNREADQALASQYPYLTDDQRAQFISEQRDPKGKTLGNVLGSIFSGRGRALPGVEEIAPEDVMGMGTDSLQAATGEMATIDPVAVQNIWAKQLNESGVEHEWSADPEGNPILSYRDPETQEVKRGYINKPGASAKDLPFLTGAVLTALVTKGAFGALAPRGLQARVAASGLVRAPVVGGGAAVGSVGMDSAANLSGADISKEQMAQNSALSFVLGTAASPVADLMIGGAKRLASKMKQIASGGESAQISGVRSIVTEGSPKEIKALFDNADSDFWKALRAEGEGKTLSPEEWRDQAIYMAIEKEVPGFKPLKAFITRDASDFAELDKAARGGKYGPEVQNRLSQIMQENQSAVDARAAGIVRAPDEAGAIVREGLRGRTDAARENVRSLYDKAYDEPGEFAAEAVAELPSTLTRKLESEGFKMTGDSLPEELSTTKKLLTIFEDAAKSSKTADQVIPAKAGVTSSAKVIQGTASDTPLVRLEAARRYAGQLAQAADNNADRSAARKVMQAYDDWFDDALNKELYKGNPESVEALKTARAAHSDRRKTFGQNDSRSESGRKISDQAGKVIADIIELDLNPVSVIDNIMGRGQLGLGKSSVAILDRMQKAVGRDSPEWSAMQEAALHRVFYDPKGRLKSTDQIVKGWDSLRKGDGREWAGRLFGKKQFSDVDRFVSVLERTQSPTNVYVPSGAPVERLENSLLGRLTTMAARSKFWLMGDVANQQLSRISDKRAVEAGKQAVNYIAPKPQFIPSVSLRGALIGAEKSATQSQNSAPSTK